MKRIIPLLIGLIATVSSAFSQNNYQEVVYLKNGSIIRGLIIEQVPNRVIKIQTADGSVWVYEFEEIEKITKEIKEVKIAAKDTAKKEGIYKTKGFASTTRMGVYANTNGYYLSVTGSIGYQFNSKYALTVGAGLFRGNENMLPVFLMNRISFMDGMVTPTLGIEAGYIFIKEKNYNYYSFGRSNDHYDSVYLNPSVGVKIRMSRNSSWGFDFGYRYWAILNEYNTVNENNIGLITFQTGVEF